MPTTVPRHLNTTWFRVGPAHRCTLIINIGGDKYRMNKLTHYHGRLSGVIGDKSGLDK